MLKENNIRLRNKEDPFGSDSFSIASPIAKAYLNLLKGEVYNSPDYRTILSNARKFGPDIFSGMVRKKTLNQCWKMLKYWICPSCLFRNNFGMAC